MMIRPAQPQLIAANRARYHMRKMSGFGSVATGTELPDADVDQLVEIVPGQAPSGLALVDMQGELAEAFNRRRVDLACSSKLRNPRRCWVIEPQLQTLHH